VVHLPKGQIGSLKADQINSLTDGVKNASDVGESQTPPPIPARPIASGRFPIYVRLGFCVSEDGACPEDEETPANVDNEDGSPIELSFRHGYEWTEVGFSRTSLRWSDSANGRAFTCNNAAYAIGIDASQPIEAMPVYAGDHVMLFPSHDMQGNPLLVFEPPAPQSTFFPARIVSAAGTECNIDPEGAYRLRRVTVTFTEQGAPIYTDDAEAPLVDATNLAEINGGDMGGQIANGSGGCSVAWSPTPIPAGTVVFAKRVGIGEGGEWFGFFATNDKCVACCEEGGFASSQRPVSSPATRMPNWTASRLHSAPEKRIDQEMKT
tara:strand:+ start:8043 stop:9008 length:966 start_codon:yes stop_codon:yes gene_type:complete